MPNSAIILLNAASLLDDLIKLLDDAPWYVYLLLVLAIVLILLAKPFLKERKNMQQTMQIIAGETVVANKTIDPLSLVKWNRSLLANGDTKKVLSNLETYAELDNNTPLKTELAHLNARFVRDKKLLDTGQKDIKDNIELNRINHRLLKILEELMPA